MRRKLRGIRSFCVSARSFCVQSRSPVVAYPSQEPPLAHHRTGAHERGGRPRHDSHGNEGHTRGSRWF